MAKGIDTLMSSICANNGMYDVTGFFPDCYEECSSFLRHKMTMFSPSMLHQYSIPFNKVL